MSETIGIDRIGPSAARVTLQRPAKRNALSVALRDEVSDALDAMAGDESCKCVVITGAGEVFSAGFDLSEFRRAAGDADFSRALWASSDRFHHTLLSFPLPLLAAVNGPALAGGFDLAVCCDVRIAVTTARFAHPEFTFGDVVYSPLHDLVGGAVARELCLTGRELTAQEALTLGLVSEVVAPEALDDAVARVVQRIDTAPRDRLMRTKAKAIARAAIAVRETLDL
ncbi:enoyl-CoA hydratase/isomerase family protein [Candidatus Binatia bacterium]|nr:enoyl-CoA hydratase/isomerase family protein [Candidatus Binatia bacterium]